MNSGAADSFISARRTQIGIYMSAVFLYWVSLYLYVPTLPVYAQSKTDNLSLVGVVLAMYGLWQAVIRLPLGIAADWLGWRKPFILIGFALAGGGAWIMGTADQISGLIIGRAVTGFAAGTWVLLVALFSSLFPPREAVRATAMLTLVNSVSRMIATGVTGSLNEWGGYALPFTLSVGVAGLAMLLVLPGQEVRRPPKAPVLADIGRLITRRDVLLPASLNAVTQYAAWAATFGFFPILARDLGADDVTLSFLMSMNIGIILLGNLAVTTLVGKIGSQRMVAVGFLLQALGIGIAAAAGQLWMVFAAQICMGLAGGIAYPVLMGMSIQFVEDQRRTTAMGLHQAVYAIGMFAGPWASGIMADAMGLQPMFGITAFGVLLIGLAGTYFLREAAQDQSEAFDG